MPLLTAPLTNDRNGLAQHRTPTSPHHHDFTEYRTTSSTDRDTRAGADEPFVINAVQSSRGLAADYTYRQPIKPCLSSTQWSLCTRQPGRSLANKKRLAHTTVNDSNGSTNPIFCEGRGRKSGHGDWRQARHGRQTFPSEQSLQFRTRKTES